MSWTEWANIFSGAGFTDLSAMSYIVPFVLAALLLLFAAAFIDLASFARKCCDVCKECFSGVFELRRHIKAGHGGKEEGMRKAA